MQLEATIVGFFRAGVSPSSLKRPFGLRRVLQLGPLVSLLGPLRL